MNIKKFPKLSAAIFAMAAGMAFAAPRSGDLAELSTEPNTCLRDEAHKMGSQVFIRGTVLLSYQDEIVVVQSRNHFFRIKRGSIATQTPKALDRPGSKIQLSTSIKGIEYAWVDTPKTD